MLSGKRIILGITGGIAAYKAAELLRAFQKQGAEVRVTMTPSATRFIGTETLSSLAGEAVATEIFPEHSTSSDWTRHIHWGEWADLFVIAPCTANTLASIAHGISDNMLTATVLAARCPLLICPTMDGEMFEAPATQRNLSIIRDHGYYILEPETGYLASGLEGKGRLPETDNILNAAERILAAHKPILKGKKVLVTAGPTREYLDPVRYISNPSSGKMGFAMAEAAAALGADVHLIHGPVELRIPSGIGSSAITTAQDLFEAVKEHKEAGVIIMTAAVADFTPVTTQLHKVKKADGMTGIDLKPTTDILAWLGEHRSEGQTLIGFAMETSDLEVQAQTKLRKKNADWIIANQLRDKDTGFGSDSNTVLILGKKDKVELSGTKKELAFRILEHIFG